MLTSSCTTHVHCAGFEILQDVPLTDGHTNIDKDLFTLANKPVQYLPLAA